MALALACNVDPSLAALSFDAGPVPAPRDASAVRQIPDAGDDGALDSGTLPSPDDNDAGEHGDAGVVAPRTACETQEDCAWDEATAGLLCLPDDNGGRVCRESRRTLGQPCRTTADCEAGLTCIPTEQPQGYVADVCRADWTDAGDAG